ncbi:MAG: O-acetylhomoserine aminocarboxypropyltransferase [Deltaproteobacteria bacterium]|nr:MAG: O-acetylhomoserine aminocarboxypropyltransferase [Deltaproteobacteria bacterium]
MKSSGKIDTRCVQAGYLPQNGEPRITPIVQSTTYQYGSADEVADLFDLKAEGHMYSRISNPTVAVLESKINALEGGVGAVATASGQAAVTLAVLSLCSRGDNFIALSNLYGGTINLFTHTLKKIGIDVRFVDINAPLTSIVSKIDDRTKLVYGETIGNPGVEVLDIEQAAALAHEHNLPLMIDSTFATPVLCRPFEFGADIVMHSATKYLDGHATCVGGLLVDSGNFDWEKSGRFPEFVQPDPSYHGLSYTQSFGNQAFITRARTNYVRDIGFLMSPMNAFLINLGMETLHLRMQRHSQNALHLAKFLEDHPAVDWVAYPGLSSSPTYDLAQKYLPDGQGGILSFGLKGGLAAGKKFIDALKLISLVVHVADVRSHVLHPASMTHRQLSDEQKKAAGIRPEQIRFSVGIEDVQDIEQDLEQALAG